MEPWGHQCLRHINKIAVSNGNQEEVGESMETGDGLPSEAAERKAASCSGGGLGFQS